MEEEAPEKSPDAMAHATEGRPESDQQREGATRSIMRFTKKHVLFVSAAIAAAVLAVFTSGLANLVTGLLPDGWDEPGSGIKVVDVRRQPMSGPVLIPEAVEFDDMTDARKKVNDPDWEAQHEWYAAGRVTWEVTLVGRHRDPVVITDLRPERTGPCTERIERGTLVDDIPQGEGDKIELRTAIDAGSPELISVEDGTAYFDNGTVTLEKGETVIIAIQATSARQTCQWVLEADYVDNGKRETMTINAPGDRPFAITGYGEDLPYELIWAEACNSRAMTPEEASASKKPADCN
ncbi:hypothetical protein G5C66_16270 [Nocardioides sp. KC13]|uniref:Uncharacterized protein n=1 Tax=Nocardioides turkmenicus TaxID=2711220 RepID=A0A6M1R9K6_9ACTN|nr:hypothetical protein [Nocardioides sp. KC13]NGN94288.1 hypothetical protein [Nocardioides sp. KC13]